MTLFFPLFMAICSVFVLFPMLFCLFLVAIHSLTSFYHIFSYYHEVSQNNTSFPLILPWNCYRKAFFLYLCHSSSVYQVVHMPTLHPLIMLVNVDKVAFCNGKNLIHRQQLILGSLRSDIKNGWSLCITLPWIHKLGMFFWHRKMNDLMCRSCKKMSE